MQYKRGDIGLFFRGDPTVKAYWGLSGDAIDYSEKTGALTLYGSPLYLSGYFDLSISPLNSTSNVIYTTNVTPLQISHPTVMCWIKINDFSNDSTIIAEQPRGTWGDGRGYSLSVTTAGNVHFSIGDAGGSWISFNGNTVLSPKRWYFIAATYDGSQMRLYVNGILDGTHNTTATISFTDSSSGGPNPQTFYVGMQHKNIDSSPTTVADLAYPLNGDISELSVFSRALDKNEISQYYNWATGKDRKWYSLYYEAPATSNALFFGTNF